MVAVLLRMLSGRPCIAHAAASLIEIVWMRCALAIACRGCQRMLSDPAVHTGKMQLGNFNTGPWQPSCCLTPHADLRCATYEDAHCPGHHWAAACCACCPKDLLCTSLIAQECQGNGLAAMHRHTLFNRSITVPSNKQARTHNVNTCTDPAASAHCSPAYKDLHSPSA